MAVIAESKVQWATPERDCALEERLAGELRVPKLLAAMLVQRGYSEPEPAHKFLNPSLDDLHDPRLLPDYDLAVKEIFGAKERGEMIYIHGDYDVDGVTSAALYTRFLRDIGCNVHTHVPHRMKEGYGIHLSAVKDARELGAKLFLTCDCGISAHEQIRMAKDFGMRVVVTDHHTVGDDLPDADALVNPHRPGSRYPYPEISGAGVAFKLCEGISSELGIDKHNYYRAFLDLAALGTIADVMPLEDENRIIAKFGLKRIKDTKKVGLQALLRESELSENPEITARHVGWVIGPRLNAAGRIDDAAVALKLLLEQDEIEAALLARQIEVINRDRKAEQDRILDQAVDIVQSEGLHERNVIVVGREGWHAGVIGIVAGRLVEQFNRPAFVASIDLETGRCKGSARTIRGFNLAEAIKAHGHVLVGGGGHAMAAGFTIMVDRLSEFGDALHQYAGIILRPEDFIITIAADLEIGAGEVTYESVEALKRLEPYGCGNPDPVFLARDMRFIRINPTKNPEHVQVSMRRADSSIINGIAFRMGERFGAFVPPFGADVLFQPQIDEYNGMTQLKWVIRDFAASEPISLL